MQLFYYQSKEGNFGDDLNSWLWPQLMPDCWQEEDDTLFVGIGTILNNALPEKNKYAVFGSGVGYQEFSKDITEGIWDVLCVRGPLSARVLGVASDKAVTDTALLVREVHQLVPVENRSGVVFVPHISTVGDGKWQEVCQKAGVKYIDPRTAPEIVVEEIAKSSLVVADAMHAAILADAMRVPWIPVVTTVEINTFKWLDWTEAMQVPYKPILLSQSSLQEKVKNIFFFLKGEVQTLFLKTADSNKQLNLPDNAVDAAFSYHEEAVSSLSCMKILRMKCFGRVYRRGVSPVLNLSLVQKLLSPLDRMYFNRAVKSLKHAVQSDSYLSDEMLCNKKLQELKALLEDIKKSL